MDKDNQERRFSIRDITIGACHKMGALLTPPSTLRVRSPGLSLKMAPSFISSNFISQCKCNSSLVRLKSER